MKKVLSLLVLLTAIAMPALAGDVPFPTVKCTPGAPGCPLPVIVESAEPTAAGAEVGLSVTALLAILDAIF